MKEIALIGSTGSGKSDLALKLAEKYSGIILSLDSISVYKEIDIASAKPSKEELSKVRHFGVDEIYPDRSFNVVMFFDLYKKAKEFAKQNGKNLIIVGGSSFYLKSLISGISDLPRLSKENREKVSKLLKDLHAAYDLLEKKDPKYAEKIKPADRYRIEKALTIIYGTDTPPSKWFEENERNPVIKDIEIFNIKTDREALKERVFLRTEKMFQQGILGEAAFLERKYGMGPLPLHSIGLKECYDYLNGKTSLEEAKELISIHTMQLAKRQRTFNRHQFGDIISKPLSDLEKEIIRHKFC